MREGNGQGIEEYEKETWNNIAPCSFFLSCDNSTLLTNCPSSLSNVHIRAIIRVELQQQAKGQTAK